MHQVTRARILLKVVDGRNDSTIADVLEIESITVERTLQRFTAGGAPAYNRVPTRSLRWRLRLKRA